MEKGTLDPVSNKEEYMYTMLNLMQKEEFIEKYQFIFNNELDEEIEKQREKKNRKLNFGDTKSIKDALQGIYKIMNREDEDIKTMQPMLWDWDLIQRINRRQQQVEEFNKEMEQVLKSMQLETTHKIKDKLWKQK